MAVLKMQCAFQQDTPFPRDSMVITPHFSISTPLGDEQALVNDLAAGLQSWCFPVTQITVKCYDAQAAAPNFPLAEATVDAGTYATSGVNRDVALCLSFHDGQNRPRHRGRLYVPCGPAGITPSGANPSAANLQRVADLVPIFTGLGGIDVDWCVFSRIDNAPRSIQHWWVDNQWDTQRRRGREATSRLEGDVGE